MELGDVSLKYLKAALEGTSVPAVNAMLLQAMRSLIFLNLYLHAMGPLMDSFIFNGFNSSHSTKIQKY